MRQKRRAIAPLGSSWTLLYYSSATRLTCPFHYGALLAPSAARLLPQHSPAFCRRTQDITTVYQKERHEFGRPVNTFAPTDAAVLDEFLPEKAEFAHIERNPTILDVQAIPQMSETYVRGSPSTAPRQSPPHFSILTRMVFPRLRVRCR